MGDILQGIGAVMGGTYMLLVYGGAFIICLWFLFGKIEELGFWAERKLRDDKWWGTRFLRWYFNLPYGIRKTVRIIWQTFTVGIGVAIFIWGLINIRD